MTDNKHLSVEKISESLHAFQQDYSNRLGLLNKAYERIFTIFLENHINPRFLNCMTCKIVSDFHVIYEINEKTFIFSIIIKYGIVKGTAPVGDILFRVKNTVSKLIFEEKFLLFGLENVLSKKFMLFFMNLFASYYKPVVTPTTKLITSSDPLPASESP